MREGNKDLQGKSTDGWEYALVHALYGAKWGALSIMAIIIPARVPAIGIVAIQEIPNSPTRCQLTALNVALLHRPTPMVAPVIHIDVETGRAYWEKTRTVMAAPISMDDPRDGEWYVILLPMTIQRERERERLALKYQQWNA